MSLVGFQKLIIQSTLYTQHKSDNQIGHCRSMFEGETKKPRLTARYHRMMIVLEVSIPVSD